MSIMELGALGEFFGAIAVVVTLAYLAIQIRQNTVVQKLGAAQQILGNSVTINTLMALDEPMNELIVALSDGRDLTPTQLAKFNSLSLAVAANHWQVHLQYSSGFLDREIFDAYERRTVRLMKSKYFRDWWTNDRDRFSTGFQKYIEGLIQDGTQIPT